MRLRPPSFVGKGNNLQNSSQEHVATTVINEDARTMKMHPKATTLLGIFFYKIFLS